jgi:hypothetical protein
MRTGAPFFLSKDELRRIREIIVCRVRRFFYFHPPINLRFAGTRRAVFHVFVFKVRRRTAVAGQIVARICGDCGNEGGGSAAPRAIIPQWTLKPNSHKNSHANPLTFSRQHCGQAANHQPPARREN